MLTKLGHVWLWDQHIASGASVDDRHISLDSSYVWIDCLVFDRQAQHPTYAAFTCANMTGLQCDVGVRQGRVNVYFVDTVKCYLGL